MDSRKKKEAGYVYRVTGLFSYDAPKRLYSYADIFFFQADPTEEAEREEKEAAGTVIVRKGNI
jgi:hypothetical protein